MTEQNLEAEMAQLQMLEQNMKALDMQRQNMQLQLMEAENSLKELETYEGKPFKIVGPIMIAAEKDVVIKELNEKVELLKVRVDGFTKQEATLKEQFESIQTKLMSSLSQQQKNK